MKIASLVGLALAVLQVIVIGVIMTTKRRFGPVLAIILVVPSLVLLGLNIHRDGFYSNSVMMGFLILLLLSVLLVQRVRPRR